MVRIGTSPPAPLLTLVVQPNDWEKHMRATATASGRTWRAEDFFAALDEAADEVVATAARRLYDHIRHASSRGFAYWGEGRRPSMTAQIPVGSLTLQPWSFYLEGAAGGGPVFALNFEWIYKDGRGVSEQAVAAFAEQLRVLPGVAGHIDAGRSGRVA